MNIDLLADKEKFFFGICKTVLVELLSDIEKKYSPRLCPDQYVGKIGELSSDYFNLNKRKPIFEDQSSAVINDNILKAKKIMILILESPHTDEYNDKGEAIGPAMGKSPRDTGHNIVKHLKTVFPKLTDYHLVLMNAIPFQCSLGVKPEKFRDDVFDKAWKKDKIGRTFFENRLKALLNGLAGDKSVVIVNACTKDKDDKNNKGRKSSVTDSLKTIKKELPDNVKITTMWETPHPASWWSKKNRFYIEIKD